MRVVVVFSSLFFLRQEPRGNKQEVFALVSRFLLLSLFPQQIHNSSAAFTRLRYFYHPIVRAYWHLFPFVRAIPAYIWIFSVEYPISSPLKHLYTSPSVEANTWNTPIVIVSVPVWCKGIVYRQGGNRWPCSSYLKELV